MAKGHYRCECGKEFDDSQKFNNHKSHCPDHYLVKYGSLEPLQERRARSRARIRQGGELKRTHQQERKKQQLQQWAAEQHRCEHCGKIMTEKYGSGRFCCKSCANSHTHSYEVRQRLSDKVRCRLRLPLKEVAATPVKPCSGKKQEASSKRQGICSPKRRAVPRQCIVCGKPVQGSRRTCSDECKHQRMHEVAVARVQKYGGNSNTLGFCSYKQGNYEGIHFNSSWELAYYVYSRDHGITVHRNTAISFAYKLDGESHLYFPDFILEDGTYVEIKGRITKAALAKKEQFPTDQKYLFLTHEDLKPMLSYCRRTYGTRFWEALYDKKMGD